VSVACCKISVDGKLLLVPEKESTGIHLKLLNIETGEIVNVLKGTASNINYCNFSHSGRYVISISEDKSIKIYDLQQNNKMRSFKHNHRGFYCAISIDEKKLIIGVEKKNFSI